MLNIDNSNFFEPALYFKIFEKIVKIYKKNVKF